MIRDGRNSHLWPASRAKAGAAGQNKHYGIATTHSQPEIWRRLTIGTLRGPANGLPAEGPTDWIQLQTSVATLYYFSQGGSAEEGPQFRVESPSLWIKRLPNGRILLWFGQPGTTPPAVP